MLLIPSQNRNNLPRLPKGRGESVYLGFDGLQTAGFQIGDLRPWFLAGFCRECFFEQWGARIRRGVGALGVTQTINPDQYYIPPVLQTDLTAVPRLLRDKTCAAQVRRLTGRRDC